MRLACVFSSDHDCWCSEDRAELLEVLIVRSNFRMGFFGGGTLAALGLKANGDCFLSLEAAAALYWSSFRLNMIDLINVFGDLRADSGERSEGALEQSCMNGKGVAEVAKVVRAGEEGGTTWVACYVAGASSVIPGAQLSSQSKVRRDA
jgi:hypothetical protein